MHQSLHCVDIDAAVIAIELVFGYEVIVTSNIIFSTISKTPRAIGTPIAAFLKSDVLFLKTKAEMIHCKRPKKIINKKSAT